jgi:hypothetical protein
MKGCSLFVSTFAIAFMGQFCSEIGLKASGEFAASDFGKRIRKARFILDRSADWLWNWWKSSNISDLIDYQYFFVKTWTKTIRSGASKCVHLEESRCDFFLCEGVD